MLIETDDRTPDVGSSVRVSVMSEEQPVGLLDVDQVVEDRYRLDA
ncbi:MAG: hypothetical protein ACI8P0_002517, partial [Planctomycetaceae bacterium]